MSQFPRAVCGITFVRDGCHAVQTEVVLLEADRLRSCGSLSHTAPKDRAGGALPASPIERRRCPHTRRFPFSEVNSGRARPRLRARTGRRTRTALLAFSHVEPDLETCPRSWGGGGGGGGWGQAGQTEVRILCVSWRGRRGGVEMPCGQPEWSFRYASSLKALAND